MERNQSEQYRKMSEDDRIRYDRQRRLLKEGFTAGMSCSCEPQPENSRRDETLAGEPRPSVLEHGENQTQAQDDFEAAR